MRPSVVRARRLCSLPPARRGPAPALPPVAPPARAMSTAATKKRAAGVAEGEEEDTSPELGMALRTMREHVWPRGRPGVKLRVLGSVALLVGAKAATIAVPFLFKALVDHGFEDGAALGLSEVDKLLLVGPTSTVLMLGFARASAAGLAEARDVLFSRVSQEAIRTIALDTFKHLHELDLRWHTSKRTGTVTRVLDRGNKSIDSLLRSLALRIVPTSLELVMVTGILASQCGGQFALVSSATLAAYSWFTVSVTSWRTKFRQDMNRLENRASSQAVDSLLNFETVKIFGNEAHEAAAYDATLAGFQRASLKTQSSLSILNFGQNLIFSVGLTGVMLLVVNGVKEGTMTVGDLVLVNGLLAQLAVPLNFVGTIYRETTQAMTDMHELHKLRRERAGVRDGPEAKDLVIASASPPPVIEFRDVHFRYEPDSPPVLNGLTFSVALGQTVALVGPSGCGKSTALRLMVRFFDPTQGSVFVYGQDVQREVTLRSLRQAMAIIPQDTVLFNDTLFHNLQYGNLAATKEDVWRVVHQAQLAPLVERLPAKLDTLVGERGLKLSGGERQRVAIARAMLKNAPILLCDEATSSLDVHTEADIMNALGKLIHDSSARRTTVLVAHRLSTVRDADKIVVLDHGKVREEGTHEELMDAGGLYAEMWEMQRVGG